MDPAAVDLFSPDKPEDIKMAEDEAEQIETKERQEFKEKVISILSMNSYEDKRAAKIDIMGFLDLLRLFNEGGIHFKWLINQNPVFRECTYVRKWAGTFYVIANLFFFTTTSRVLGTSFFALWVVGPVSVGKKLFIASSLSTRFIPLGFSGLGSIFYGL